MREGWAGLQSELTTCVVLQGLLVWARVGRSRICVGVLGAPAVLIARPIRPYAFDFAAGAMSFVVVEEVVSESQRSVFTQKKGGIHPK